MGFPPAPPSDCPHTHTKGVSPFSSCSGSAPQGQRGAVSSIEAHGEAQRAPLYSPPPTLMRASPPLGQHSPPSSFPT